MNNLAGLLSAKPYKIFNNLLINQPTIQDIVQMTEEKYWSFVKIWTLKRSNIIIEENEFSRNLTDCEIWKRYIVESPELKRTLEDSSLIFFRKKLEFLPHNNTIYIGEIQEGLIIDENVFYTLQNVFTKLADGSVNEEKSDQYRKDAPMDSRARALIEKMEASQQRIDKIKNRESNPEDSFGRQIVALVAIGHYTFEQVYNMTMLQFIYLIKKYTDIQNYELHTIISPYISSTDSGPEVKHWLNT